MLGPNCSRLSPVCERKVYLEAAGVSVPPPVFAVLALVAVAGSIGATVWWFARRGSTGSRAATVAWHSVAAGTLGGLVMIPPGLFLKAAGHSVNVYGELLLRSVFGQVLPSAMAVEHLAISAAMAVPFVVVATGWPGRLRRHLLSFGAGYGALSWLAVNSFTLPVAFGRPTPWAVGFDAIWPSLLVHVLYGLALGAVVAWDDRRSQSPETRPEASVAVSPGR